MIKPERPIRNRQIWKDGIYPAVVPAKRATQRCSECKQPGRLMWTGSTWMHRRCFRRVDSRAEAVEREFGGYSPTEDT